MAFEELAKPLGGEHQRLHFGGGAQMLTGLLAQQGDPAGDGAGPEPLDRAQALAAERRRQAAELAGADQQHPLGQDLGQQHGLAEAKAAGLEQGFEQGNQLGRQQIEGRKALEQGARGGGGHRRSGTTSMAAGRGGRAGRGSPAITRLTRSCSQASKSSSSMR